MLKWLVLVAAVLVLVEGHHGGGYHPRQVLKSEEVIPVVEPDIVDNIDEQNNVEQIKPQEVEEEPVDSPRKPEPEMVAKEPEIIMKEPEIVKKDPEVIMEEPEMVAKEPEIIKKEPEMIMEEPEMVAKEPEMVKKEPEMIMEEPEMVAKEPEMIMKEPEMMEKEPEMMEKEPEMMENEPEMMAKEPEMMESEMLKKDPEMPAEMPEKNAEETAMPAKETEMPAEQPASESVDEVKDTPREEEDKEDSKASYFGAQVLRVTATTQEQKDLLSNLEESRMVDTWLRPAKGANGQIDIMVPASMVESVKMRLADLKTEFTVIIENVQKAIEVENPPVSEEEMEELAGRMGHRMTWNSYHRVADIHGYLDYLAQTYPDICTVTTIGSSIEGKPLKLLRISSRSQGGGSKPAFWIDGGIHAREWISPASVSYIIQELVENRENHGRIAEDIDYYILPVVNPDGYEYTHGRERLWRKNRKDPHLGRCAGTDLNRNWGYKWGGAGSSRDKCKEIYAGQSAFSEPETQAIRNFVSGQASNIKAYVTFHSYGQYILYPWGYDRKVPPDYADLDRVGKQAAQAMRSAGGASYTVGNSASLLYPASGGADDWAKGGAKIKYTYTIELRDKGQYGFLLPAQFILPTAREAFAAIKTISQAILTT